MDAENLPVSSTMDPVIEAYKPGVDQTIFRHNLQLTVSQRVEQLRDFMRSLEEMREMGRRSRNREKVNDD